MRPRMTLHINRVRHRCALERPWHVKRARRESRVTSYLEPVRPEWGPSRLASQSRSGDRDRGTEHVRDAALAGRNVQSPGRGRDARGPRGTV